ncbi:WD-40 repeat-containing protein [Rhizoctonia solani]|uniref:WD-40 repeat-containing protein n=1 Tax=Rhizoctonia solani TaxID=456999 RepID=A0A8H8NRA4_9AGAM|nr:WD-40 repeat-containing protein [Rhizoctonia solani]QRW18454.1 WD-40 repeat-containing protein [Rhizoctonia solani]
MRLVFESPKFGAHAEKPTHMSQFVNPTSVSSEARRATQGSTGDSTLISISTRFNLESPDIQDSDLVLVAKDNVYFYAHKSILLLDSSNRFGSLIPLGTNETQSQGIDHTSEVLNVVLHAIYKFSVEGYRPSPATLRKSTHALSSLGYNLSYVYAPHSELFMLFLQAGVAEPLEMYALAAQYALEDLAVAVSTFTLSVSPSEITDELSVQMGPIYLRRLFFLHLGRADALKRLLYPPPIPHTSSPEPNCGPETHNAVSRIWALACATVVVENNPNNLASIFAPLSAQLQCPRCRQTLQERVATLINDWGSIKCTI